MTQEIRVTLRPDDKGMVGRECPNTDCGRYFKLRPGTGLPTDVCHCPYCGTKGGSGDFITADQLEYAKSVAVKKIVDPMIGKFSRDIARLNRGQGGGLIQLEFSVKHTPVRLHSYLEKQLETEVTCDNCGLEFAVYGVFASCPDCSRLNALKVCLASLETAKKKLVLSRDESLDGDLRRDFLQDAPGAAVAAFDAYGKAIRAHRGGIRPGAKANLFQDIEALDAELQAAGLPSLEQLLGSSAWEELKWLFQARHVYTHAAGVIDARFISKQPTYAGMLGRLLPLGADRLEKTIEALGHLAEEIDARMK